MSPARVPARWVLLAGAAAEGAWVGAPLTEAWAEAGPLFWTVALIPALVIAWGLRRRSSAALLVGAPLGWALLSCVSPAAALPAAAAVGVVSLWAYAIAAIWWLRGLEAGAPALVTWQALESAGADRAARGQRLPPVAIVAAAVVAVPALAVVIWSPIRSAVAAGFGRLPGLAMVGLGLTGTLLGLAVAGDLVRPRLPRRGRRGHAVGLALALVGLLVLLGAVGGV